jgi:zinc protease
VFITGDGKDMQHRLATEAASPMKYNTDKPAELVAEDDKIAVYPLGIPAANIKVQNVDEVFQ